MEARGRVARVVAQDPMLKIPTTVYLRAQPRNLSRSNPMAPWHHCELKVILVVAYQAIHKPTHYHLLPTFQASNWIIDYYPKNNTTNWKKHKQYLILVRKESVYYY